MKYLKRFIENQDADIKMISMVVAVLITIIVSILVFYNIAASIDYSTADDNIQKNVYGLNATERAASNIKYAQNASVDTMDQAETFYAIAPIIAIVMVAVAILGYVSRIGGA